jgi:hypothetical protein
MKAKTTLLYLSPILNIAPKVDRVDASGQLSEKSAKIGPFFLSLGSVYIYKSCRTPTNFNALVKVRVVPLRSSPFYDFFPSTFLEN